MGNIFQFNENEVICFFAVMVRVSILFSLLPLLGDLKVPSLVKILLSLAVSLTLFPGLVAKGWVNPQLASSWTKTATGLMGVVFMEVFFGLLLGFTAKLAFDAIQFAGNFIGNLMGLSMAYVYDQEQQSYSQVMTEFQVALAMLLYLSLDAHHLLLRAGLESFEVLRLGGSGMRLANSFSGVAAELIRISSQVIQFAVELSAPIAVCLFGVNVAFGMMARALPQLNVLVLSASIGTLVGLAVLVLILPEWSDEVGRWFEESSNWTRGIGSKFR